MSENHFKKQLKSHSETSPKVSGELKLLFVRVISFMLKDFFLFSNLAFISLKLDLFLFTSSLNS
jgi:hypothetical protein